MGCKLVWATENIDAKITYMARVSNLSAKLDDSSEKLIGYLIKNNHWSPLEMANICVEIETTRDIARQILRHRSFHLQEFSQRYAEVPQEGPIVSVARLQDTKNRQNSVETDDQELREDFLFWQNTVWSVCSMAYKACLSLGIAKELARKLLPEGLTYTKMYMNGTVRDWYHYLNVRLFTPGTQKEHQDVAREIWNVVKQVAPITFGTVQDGETL